MSLERLEFFSHLHFPYVNAPKLAQSQSLGLQAKDWGYPLHEGERLLSAGS
jgi:hypothetical protein